MSTKNFENKFLSVANALNIGEDDAKKLLMLSLGDEFAAIPTHNNLFKEYDFIDELKELISVEDSSIKDCYFQQYLNEFRLVFTSFSDAESSNYMSLVISSYYPSTLSKKYPPAKYGVSEKDLLAIEQLLTKYHCESGVEQIYFAHRVKTALDFKEDAYGHVFKFTPKKDEEMILDNKYYKRQYCMMSKDEIFKIITTISDDSYINFTGYMRVDKYDGLKGALEVLESNCKRMVYNKVILEFYEELLYPNRLASRVWFYDNENVLHEVNASKYNNIENPA